MVEPLIQEREDAEFMTEEERWQAVVARDEAADGRFVYAVATTGVFCRPSCPSRQARRRNVRFFDSTAAAAAAGFRPCRRCRPLGRSPRQAQAEAVERACRGIEEGLAAGDELPSLETLAAEAGLSRYHFHRLFKAVTGVTPRQYAAACRGRRVREGLRESENVTAAIYDAGYGSSSRFYEQSAALLGMKPTAFRKGGAGEVIRYAVGPCPLGQVLVAATERGVCAISLGDDAAELREELAGKFSAAELHEDAGALSAWLEQAAAFMATPERGLDLPLDIRGTAFQQRVWHALRQIPSGSTASYGEVAERIGEPRAARAVARACATNSLALAVPCHRVVRGNGESGGYRWGEERKRALLAREASPGGTKPRSLGEGR